LSGRAVTNSTCLIALERIGQLALLPRVFAAVLAPPLVSAEFGSPLDWLAVTPATNLNLITALRSQLDDGEAHAIALAMELGDVIAILDDKKARRIARQMGLTVIGTVGVLLRAKRQGLIPAVQPLIVALRDARFHMTPALYGEALRLAGEAPAP
jgi:predicted nucleic acid-binding protein